MELTGRLTGDAKVNTIKDERKVVNFSIVINDRYKPKDGEVKEIATFINCAYWMKPRIAPYLTKGSLVELYGRTVMIQRNYLQIKQDVEDLVIAEIEKMTNDPELKGLVVSKS